jgi:hypothetical protein
MHRLRKTALALALGETVTLATGLPALAQAAAQPNVAVKSSQPAETSQETAKTRDGQGKGTVAGTTLAGGPQPMPSAAGGGGYSWRDKRPVRKPSGHRQKQKVDPSRTQAKGPEFALSTDGTSRISVQLSQRVEVNVVARPNQYVYELPNTQVPVPNDTNPLVTSHFSTPVDNIKLIARGKNAQLIVGFREPATPQHQMRALPGGITVLEITVPKSSSRVSAAATRHKGQAKTARGAKE